MPQQAYDTHNKSVTAFIHDNFQEERPCSLLLLPLLSIYLLSAFLHSLSATNRLLLSRGAAKDMHRCSFTDCSSPPTSNTVQHWAIDRVDGG